MRRVNAQAIKTLEGVIKLFGPKGKHWGRGQFHYVDTNEVDHYCLLGALREVDGPGEGRAELVLEFLVPATFIPAFNDQQTSYTPIKRLIKKAITTIEKKDPKTIEDLYKGTR